MAFSSFCDQLTASPAEHFVGLVWCCMNWLQIVIGLLDVCGCWLWETWMKCYSLYSIVYSKCWQDCCLLLWLCIGMSCTISNLSGPTWIPLADTICPRIVRDVLCGFFHIHREASMQLVKNYLDIIETLFPWQRKLMMSFRWSKQMKPFNSLHEPLEHCRGLFQSRADDGCDFSHFRVHFHVPVPTI